MDIQLELLRALYDNARAQGHPDPIGMFSRIKNETDFEVAYQGKNGHVGFAGVQARRANQLGIQGFIEIEEAVDAAIQIDIDNYNRVDGDIDKMHLAWIQGVGNIDKPLSSSKRKLSAIDKGRTEIASMLGVGDPKLASDDIQYPSDKELKDAFGTDNYKVTRMDASPLPETPVVAQIDQKERDIASLIELIKVQ